MLQVKATIGLNYGDEGKGMWVDHLVRTSENPLVIRANGGSQVGHTVCRGSKRYIFSHIGSGSLEGAPTLFTRDTVVNPIIFLEETTKRNAGVPHNVFIDRDCPVTTPYDMLLNQITEIRRGEDAHGSVGVGFGTTLVREEAGVHLTYKDLLSDDLLAEKIKRVKAWCFAQLGPQQIGDDAFTRDAYEFFKATEIELFFTEDCIRFCQATSPSNRLYIKDFSTLIFENGQGLMLDQEFGAFPHVTRSNTGFRNIGKFLKRNGLFNSVDVKCDVYYVTRCYTTRHGAGGLPYQRATVRGINVVDPTNKPNRYQGTMRLAPLNLYAINKAINWDSQSHPSNSITHSVVTCCDQITQDTTPIEFANAAGRLQFTNYTGFTTLLKNTFSHIVSSPSGP